MIHISDECFTFTKNEMASRNTKGRVEAEIQEQSRLSCVPRMGGCGKIITIS